MTLNILVEKHSAVRTMMVMSDEKPRSIRFPDKLWSAIDAEAKRCKRSSVKQMEAVLMAYYGLEDTNLNMERVGDAQELFSAGRSALPRVNENEKPQRIQKLK